MKIRGRSFFPRVAALKFPALIAGGTAIGLVLFLLTNVPAKAYTNSAYQTDANTKPFTVTTRVYEMRAKAGSYKDVSEQLFKLRNTTFVDEERIVSNFAKVFPGFDFALLKSARLKVNRTSKGALLNVGKHQKRSIDITHYGANSIGDGKKPGTSLVIEVNMTYGRPEAVSYGMQTVEAEDGMTYFFSPTNLKFAPADYANFLRPGTPAKPFEGYDRFLVIAVSVELIEKPASVRSLDAAQSLEFRNSATRKVAPELTPDVRSAGLKGNVTAQVEVGPDGRVSHALVENSTLPEMNAVVIAAVRQWEFPTTSFVSDKRPVRAAFVFDFNQATSSARGSQSAPEAQRNALSSR